jgi:HK97 family phage major capsid protein
MTTISKEEQLLENLKTGLQKEITPLVDGLQDQIDKLNQKQHALGLFKGGDVSFIDFAAKSATKLVENFKRDGRYAQSEITMKSGPLDMGVSTTTGAGVILGEREPGIHSAPKRRPVILDYIQVGTTSAPTVEWIEKTDEAGLPAFRREFEEHPKRSWKTVLKKAHVKKIGVYVEYSKEILEDLEGFQQELRSDLVEQVQLLLDNNLLNGQGGEAGDQDMKGILEFAQPWSNIINGQTLTVESPNIFDVIAVGMNQIEEEHHAATAVLMRPSTALEMQLSKNKDGVYVLPPFTTKTGLVIAGMPVVTNTLLSPKEIVLLDGNKAKYFFRRNWQLEISDSHGDNFTKDVITVKLTGRGALRIKDTDAYAFVHVTNVDTALTALTPGS